MSPCVAKPENRPLIADPGAGTELDTLPLHGSALATRASAFLGLSGRWQHCAADASSPRTNPTFPLPLPGAWKRGAGSCAFRLSVAAVPHHLQTVCAWRVTTGLNPQRGADSDSGVLVAPGITVSLANWPNSLDFLFFTP